MSESRGARELMSSERHTERGVLPIALLALYVIVFILLGIAPYDRATWWAENIPIVALAGALVVLYVRDVRLSNLAYLLASVLLFMHTVGGHYTFERDPFGWVTRAFGFVLSRPKQSVEPTEQVAQPMSF